MNKPNNELNKTNNEMNKTNNEMNKTNNELNKTDNEMYKKDNEMNKTDNVIYKKDNAIYKKDNEMHKTENDIKTLEQLLNLFRNNMDTIEITTATRWADIGWNVPEGTRADFEINYFLKGKAEVEIKGNSNTALPGDLFLIDNSKGNFCKTGNFVLFFFSFSIRDIEKSGKALYEKIRQCLSTFPIKLTPGISDGITKLYSEMIREYSVKRFGYELNLKLYAIQLFIELARGIESSSSNIKHFQKNKYSEMVSEIMNFFQENNTAKVNLTELGNMHLLNPRYLNRVFKGATGLPILKYCQRVKLEKAKRLLSASNLDILDIALELGFESSQSFSKFFRKNSGFTPTGYRKLR